MKLHWPRGKYNGERIVGIEFKIILDVTQWYWLPMRVKFCGGFHWLCFRTFTQASYRQEIKPWKPTILD